MKKITFFGLGNMGLPIALNLVRAGYEVTSCIHHDKAGPRALEAAGGKIAASREAALEGAELVFSIVPNDLALKELFQNDAVYESMPANTIIVDMTSSSADAIIAVADRYAKKGVTVIDAPVSGGTRKAANGTMAIMCGGDKAVFDRIKPVLDVIAGSVIHVGAVGDGKKIKSLNNLLGAISKIALAESIKLIEHAGVNPRTFYEVVTKSSGNSVPFERDFFKYLARDYTPTFTLALMTKDLRLAMGLAEDLDLPLSRMALQLYEDAAEFAQEDSGAVLKRLDEKNPR